MASSANVRSVEALRRFRGRLAHFCDVAGRALGEAESEINRTLDWVEHTQGAHWRREKQVRTDDISSARAAVFRREMRSMDDNVGGTEERQNLSSAKIRLREAEERARKVKTWSHRLREEADRYYAAVERLSTAVRVELPEGTVRLGRLIDQLEAYLAVAGPAGERRDASGGRARDGSGSKSGVGSVAVEEGAGGLPRPWWERLRQRAKQIGSPSGGAPQPGGQAADSIEAGDVAARIGDVQLEGLEPGATVVVEQAALAGREFFLLRRRIEGGSEWVVASTGEEPVREAVRVPAASVARRLGEWAGVLHLPVGWLAIVTEGRLRLVVDAEDSPRLEERGE